MILILKEGIYRSILEKVNKNSIMMKVIWTSRQRKPIIYNIAKNTENAYALRNSVFIYKFDIR
jgi:hypothetical protein